MQHIDFKHSYADKVRWGDCDPLGHLNNTVYIRLIESGRIDYFLNVMNIDLKPDSHEGWIMVDLKCDFKAQVHYPSTIEVNTRIIKVGNSSITVEANIYANGNPAPVFTSVSTGVWCNYAESVSVRIPDAIRASIKQHEGAIDGL